LCEHEYSSYVTLSEEGDNPSSLAWNERHD